VRDLDIEFTFHARKQIAARGISEDDVREALTKKEVVYPSGEGGKTWVRSQVGGRDVKVLCSTWGGARVTVITAAIRE